MGNFTEVEKEHPASRSGSVERSHFFGPVNYMNFTDDVRIPHSCLRTTFEVWEEPLLMLDTSVLTDQEKTNFFDEH